MRAVCTRGRLEGDENGHAHTRGEGRGSLFSFSPRDGGKNTSSREEALLFRREDPFSTLRQSFFCLASFFPFFFFFKPTTLFSGPRLPTGKGWKPRGREGRNRSSFAHPRFSARLVIISRYYPACILQFCCCSRAIALAVR